MEDHHKEKAQDHSHEDEEQRPEGREGRGKLYRMAGLLSTICLSVFFVVCFAFAFHYWQSGNKNRTLFWAFGAYAFVGLAAVFYIHHYVDWPNPEAAQPKPLTHAPVRESATPSLSPKSTPDPTPTPKLPRMPKMVGSGPASRDRPQPKLKWTEYTEDEFYDVIWRWHYRPPDKTPRDIKPYCPECSFQNELAWKLVFPEPSMYQTAYPPYKQRAPYLVLRCNSHPQRYEAEHIPNMQLDDFSKIKELILAALENGSWEAAVTLKRQRAKMSGGFYT